jgi:plastocyanin
LETELSAVFDRLVKLVTASMIMAIGFADVVHAGDLRVTVLDNDGQPVPGVAVYVEDATPSSAPAGTSAVMDQVDQRFVPHLLVIQTGTLVEFPNSDVVAHHVYSFSHPNHFKLPIYKGHAHAPVSFDENGLVVLGCNIHDHMLAYILVVDTPVFATTNDDGIAMLNTQPGDNTTVSIWNPRIRDGAENLSVSVEAVDHDTTVVFNLVKPLRAPHHDRSKALSWNDY